MADTNNSGPAEAVKGIVEDAKGKVKEAVGAVAGRDDLTREGQARVNVAVCADVGRVLRGERPNNFVNLPKPARLQTA